MIARFLAAVQFLTLIPVRLREHTPLGKSALYFPVVGSFLGAIAGFVLQVTAPTLGGNIAALLALCGLTLLTGGLHEDGLADVADGCRSGRSPDRILEIMKDSRIGTYGALALILLLLLRWQALASLSANPIPAVVASVALSRTAMVALAGFAPALGSGLGATFKRDLSQSATAAAVLAGCSIAVLALRWDALMVIFSSMIVVLAARTYFNSRLRGFTGDCLGATCVTVETINLLALAWRRSI